MLIKDAIFILNIIDDLLNNEIEEDILEFLQIYDEHLNFTCLSYADFKKYIVSLPDNSVIEIQIEKVLLLILKKSINHIQKSIYIPTLPFRFTLSSFFDIRKEDKIDLNFKEFIGLLEYISDDDNVNFKIKGGYKDNFDVKNHKIEIQRSKFRRNFTDICSTIRNGQNKRYETEINPTVIKVLNLYDKIASSGEMNNTLIGYIANFISDDKNNQIDICQKLNILTHTIESLLPTKYIKPDFLYLYMIFWIKHNFDLKGSREYIGLFLFHKFYMSKLFNVDIYLPIPLKIFSYPIKERGDHVDYMDFFIKVIRLFFIFKTKKKNKIASKDIQEIANEYAKLSASNYNSVYQNINTIFKQQDIDFDMIIHVYSRVSNVYRGYGIPVVDIHEKIISGLSDVILVNQALDNYEFKNHPNHKYKNLLPDLFNKLLNSKDISHQEIIKGLYEVLVANLAFSLFQNQLKACKIKL